MTMNKNNRQMAAVAANDVEIDRRVIEATDALELPIQMRKAATELALSWSYDVIRKPVRFVTCCVKCFVFCVSSQSGFDCMAESNTGMAAA